MSYTELQVTTNFSFLRGGSHPKEIVAYAAELDYTEIAITDRNTLAGIVRAHSEAKKRGIRIIPACRLDLMDGPSLLAYPTDRAAYARLSGLLSEGNLRAEKGSCHLYKADVYCSPGMKDIPVLIMSASAAIEKLAFDAGADAFIEKPFSNRDLLIQIHKLTNST